jgi:hypothetical protein
MSEIDAQSRLIEANLRRWKDAPCVPKTKQDLWIHAKDLKIGTHMTSVLFDGEMRDAKLTLRVMVNTFRHQRFKGKECLLLWTILGEGDENQWPIHKQYADKKELVYVFTPLTPR